MAQNYDVIIIGAGPAGVFTALELADTGASVLIVEKGLDIRERAALNQDRSAPAEDRRSNLVSGWGGAGAFSDGKLTLTTEYGGNLDDYMSKGALSRLISYVDRVYCRYGGADRKIYGDEHREKLHELKRRAAAADLAFIPARIRHLGTDVNSQILAHMREALPASVRVLCRTAVDEILVEDGKAAGIRIGKDIYRSRYVVAAPGREGAEWLLKEAERLGLRTTSNAVDIGVRVELPYEVFAHLTDELYESKIVYRTEKFQDRVRTFCMNPKGAVVNENTNGIVTVNGHSYEDPAMHTENTNFALLVSKHFTEPFRDSNGYGESIARLSNMLGGGVMVQRFGDLIRGQRSTPKRIEKGFMTPTLAATPGDLSLVMPKRILDGIIEMIYALDKIAPGTANDDTLLYGVEVKFYNMEVQLDKNLQTCHPGLFVIGDGSGVTHSLSHASASGVYVARYLAEHE